MNYFNRILLFELLSMQLWWLMHAKYLYILNLFILWDYLQWTIKAKGCLKTVNAFLNTFLPKWFMLIKKILYYRYVMICNVYGHVMHQLQAHTPFTESIYLLRKFLYIYFFFYFFWRYGGLKIVQCYNASDWAHHTNIASTNTTLLLWLLFLIWL